jgi:hypothetical protein
LSEDPDKNPETDSYYYMEIIMESMLVLDEIPAALEVCVIVGDSKTKTKYNLYFILLDHPREITS